MMKFISMMQKPQDQVGVMIKLLIVLLRMRLLLNGRYSGLRLKGGATLVIVSIIVRFCNVVMSPDLVCPS